MKRLTTSLTSLCLSAVFAMMLATAVASAQDCSDEVISSEGGGWSCSLTGEDANYCYYTCECSGITELQCANRLGLAGFELI